jgi:hypothetical protein
MAKQEGDLIVTQREYLARQMFVVRALPEDSHVTQPTSHASRMPAIAIARNDELVPVASAFVAIHHTAKRLCSLANRFTVLR